MSEQQQIAFGEWLRKRRKELDLTQGELGSRVGYSAETIRKIETGRRRPSKHLVKALAASLDIHSSEVPALVMAARATGPSGTTPRSRA